MSITGSIDNKMMNTEKPYFVLENYQYRRCNSPSEEFVSVASLHNHSCYSIEDLAPVDTVMNFFFMRPLNPILKRVFGLEHEMFEYAEIRYSPPYTVEQLSQLELNGVRSLGFDRLILAVTDHDNIDGCVEMNGIPGIESVVGVELGIFFQDHRFHLGIIGLPIDQSRKIVEELRDLTHKNELDTLFNVLSGIGCLVILNHPLLPQNGIQAENHQVVSMLLHKYHDHVHALEINSMRGQEENNQVVQLAKEFCKPVIGGGDCHSFSPSSILTVSRNATTFGQLAQEIKSGVSIILIKPQYFVSLRWRLFLRVLNFMSHYREIAIFRGVPVNQVVTRKIIGLDIAGWLSRVFLKVSGKLKLLH